MRKTMILVTVVAVLGITISTFFLVDSDGDGLSNLAEILIGSNFGNSDTDGDGINDGAEAYIHKTSPLLVDSDNDGLGDKIEIEVHKTDPLIADSDWDTLNDGLEVIAYQTDPLKTDTDDDNLNDWMELFIHNTSPLLIDTDNDGLSDYLELYVYVTNSLITDSDNDMLSDGLEVYGWLITVSGSPIYVTSNPLTMDSDWDNLSDWSEYNTYRSNPQNTDTDGDGFTDQLEVLYNTDLSDASSTPKLIKNAPDYPYLLLEIDYMSGYAPAHEAISYIESYFKHDLGITVTTIQNEVTSEDLEAINVSPESISIRELVLIKNRYHDNPNTHLYVFYAGELEGEEGGVAGPSFGVAINGKYLAGRLDRERTILLHEIGHAIGLEHTDDPASVMRPGPIFLKPVYGSVWSKRNLLDIWSVNEPWG